MATLKEQEIVKFAEKYPSWRYEDGKLRGAYSFDDFKQAIAFVNKVAKLAEELNHHPDIKVSYDKVRLILWTHSRNGVTKRDLDFVKKLETNA